jgi:YihY family inner membrane protein
VGRWQRWIRSIDAMQQRHTASAFVFGVVKKFGDDNAGDRAALVAYYGFFSLFPILMVGVTVLGWLTQGNARMRDAVTTSVLRDFPVIGSQIRSNVHDLHGTGLGLLVAGGLALWSGIGVIRSFGSSMDSIWNVPVKRRPNAFSSAARAVVMLVVLGVVAIAGALVAGLSVSGGPWRIAGFLASVALNLCVFLLAFRILTAADVRWHDVFPGAAAGALTWTLLATIGSWYVRTQLEGASEIYGTFALVIGLLGWIYLGAQVALYAAEINVVRMLHLYPRSLLPPPLTDADRQSLTRYAEEEERRPEEDVHVHFGDPSDLRRARR